MTGTITFQFMATTIDEAVSITLQRWRIMTGNEEALLPWSTHFVIKHSDADELGDTCEVTVIIDADNKMLGQELKV